MTRTSTLTDRYVDATLRRLPERQRPDIEKELRASIADAVDDRINAGGDPSEAEHDVVTELGDPARLAAGYADRPLHLIGPAFYLDYTRLLIALLATVVPAVAAALGFLKALAGGSALDVVGATLGAAVTTALHVAFWTTLVFAVAERAPALRAMPTRSWTPASLPEPPSRRDRYGELIGGTVMLVLFVTFVLVSPTVSAMSDANGEPIGLFSPWLWRTGVVYVFLALAIAGLGYTYAKYYLPWSVPVAVAGALINVAIAVMLVWLAAGDHLVNPAFAEAVGWAPTVRPWIATGFVVVAVITIVQTVVELIAGFSTRAWMTQSWGAYIRNAVDGIGRAPRR